MSDTPRTDAELRKPIHDTGIHNNLTEFCQELEREIRQLEVAVYDLKTENNQLHEALDQVVEDRDSYHKESVQLRKDLDKAVHLNQAVSMLAGLPRADEMDTLVKDGKRLDWIFRNCCVEFEGFHKDSFSNRKEVDEAMQAEEE